MQNIQDIFNRIQETKSEMKEIRVAYKDALVNSPEYGKIMSSTNSTAIKSGLKTTCMPRMRSFALSGKLVHFCFVIKSKEAYASLQKTLQ